MSGFPGMGLHRVRWPSHAEPDMQCATCYEFLPLTTEFWEPERGLRRCRACLSEANRVRLRAVRDRQTYWRNWSRRNRSSLAELERKRAS